MNHLPGRRGRDQIAHKKGRGKGRGQRGLEERTAGVLRVHAGLFSGSALGSPSPTALSHASVQQHQQGITLPKAPLTKYRDKLILSLHDGKQGKVSPDSTP